MLSAQESNVSLFAGLSCSPPRLGFYSGGIVQIFSYKAVQLKVLTY